MSKTGFIILNSESRENRANTKPHDCTFNLKHVTFEPGKKYEIALLQIDCVFIVKGAGTLNDTENLAYQLIFIESNLVEPTSYKSLTIDDKQNYRISSILASVNPSANDNVAATPNVSVMVDMPYIEYLPVMSGNMSAVSIKFRDNDDNALDDALAELGEFTMVMKYREIK